MHTTQFAIREPRFGLYRPVLELAVETARAWRTNEQQPFALVAGICGDTKQAVSEAQVAAALGYHAGLVSLGALAEATDAQLVRHCRAVSEVIPIFGFYLQPAVGGRSLGWRFWRDLAELPNLVAVKIAPFNRYATIDVVRAITEAGRDDVALYTGNDDSIVLDLLTPFRIESGGRVIERRIVGGLLGQWAVWTRSAVDIVRQIKALERDAPVPVEWLARAAALTDANGALFDVAHGFAGSIPGIHEVLRRQGLLRGVWCLDTRERLSSGQSREIDRVLRSYPELTDDAFVRENLDRWIS